LFDDFYFFTIDFSFVIFKFVFLSDFLSQIPFFLSKSNMISYIKMKVCVCMSGGLLPDIHKLSPRNLAWAPHFTQARNQARERPQMSTTSPTHVHTHGPTQGPTQGPIQCPIQGPTHGPATTLIIFSLKS